jgi:hypothetical protein
MRNTANFHPEWGYLAPTPRFIRTARIVLVATAVGTILGAGAGFSRVSHQVTEPSVAARTLVRPIEAASVAANTPAHATQANAPSSTEKRSLTVNSRSADGAANEPNEVQRHECQEAWRPYPRLPRQPMGRPQPRWLEANRIQVRYEAYHLAPRVGCSLVTAAIAAAAMLCG